MSNKLGSIKNFIYGILGLIITTIISIIIPRLFIVNYGSEINGFLSSIKQIYVYLALLEAGVGSASLQALYRPSENKDYDNINSILSATNYYYKRIGVAYFLAIILMGFIYPLFLDTDIPYYTCLMVIILQGMGSVINYLFQGKYVILLNVDNKAYINNNVVTIANVLTDLCRIGLLLNGKSIIAIQSMYLIFSLIKMVYLFLYIKKNYPWLNLNVSPNFESISQKNSVLVHQISSLIFSNTDVLILTFVCGLKTVSIYSLYASFYSMVNNVTTITSTSVQSALGRIYSTNRKKFLEIQDTFEVVYLALVFSLFTITTILILPFFKLYTSGADINYIDQNIALLFFLYQLLNYGRNTSGQIITFAGEFSSTKWRAILEAIINIVVSIIGVFYFGIYGVLFGTIAALLYRANDMILFANHRILKRRAFPTYKRWILNFIIASMLIILFFNVNLNFSNYFLFLVNAIWISLLIFSIFFSVSYLVEKKVRKVINYYIRDFYILIKKRNI